MVVFGGLVFATAEENTLKTAQKSQLITHSPWEASTETNPASYTTFISQDRVSVSQLNMLRQSEKVTSSEPPTSP